MLRFGLKFGATKGAILGATVMLLDIEFVKGLIIAVVSAGIGAWGSIRAAEKAVDEARKNRDEIREVKAGLGLDKRSGDTPPGEAKKGPPDGR